jgi:hypothetical protein
MQFNQLRPRIFLYTGLLLLLCGCTRAVEVFAPEISTAASSPAPSITASPTASATIEPTLTKTPLPTSKPKPTATPTFLPPSPLLPAPLYFLSPDDNGIDQVWRIEMDGGISHPVTAVSESVTGYDVSKWDGSLAYIMGNDLYVLRPGTEVPELILDGEEIDPAEEWEKQVNKSIFTPLWSNDGKELAFSLNGVRVLTFETGKIRSLITNNTEDLEDYLDWRTYSPKYWSPDGKMIAVITSLFEGRTLIVLSKDNGEMITADSFGCCGYAFRDDDPRYFYVANNGWHGGKLFKVNWQSGDGELLESPWEHDHPIILQNTIYFWLDSVGIVRAEMDHLEVYEVVENTDFSPFEVLWAPDASLLISNEWKIKEPLRVWFPGKGNLDLDRPGKDMKWGFYSRLPPGVQLPAPLYFLSSYNGIQQIWRMERNNGIARPVTNSKQDIVALKKDIGAYDVSRRDGSLAYVSDNKLYVLRPDSTGPELIYRGEELDPEEEWGIQVGKKVSSPLWSRDGKELAFSHNGVQVINIETNKVRSLITNNTVDLEDIMDWRAYSPRNWSPDGKSIAVGVSYYSAGGLILLDAGDGSMRSPGNYGCCSFSFPDNSRYFYIASSGYHGGGFSKADWLTGNAEWLVRPFDSDNFLDISDLVVVDDTLYFFIDDTFARTRIQNIPDYEVVSEAPNISGSILWAPDASMLIVQDWGMHEPMYIWSPGAGLFQLDQRGIELKWRAP